MAAAPVPDSPVPFGYKIRWISVPATDPAPVAETLKLSDARPANWAEGVKAAYGGSTDVTPPVDGFVLALGYGFSSIDGGRMFHGDVPDDWRAMMESLSRRFGEAWFFTSHRVSSFVGWGYARDGKVLRAFADTCGDVIVNLGERRPEEAEAWAEARRECEEAVRDIPGYLDGWDEEKDGDPAILGLEETSAVLIAAAASVDPTTLGPNSAAPALGLLEE